MINISISTNALIAVSCFILLVIVGIIAFIIYKDKKIDQAEIDELIDDLVKAKPREEEVQVTKVEPQEPLREQMNLEEMLHTMQHDLDLKNANKIETFEKDQEENAIISYKELVKAAEEKRAETELFEKDQEENAIISYRELEAKNPLDGLKQKEDELKATPKMAKIESPRENKDKKFKNTDFISPIFGKIDEHLDYPKVRSFRKNDDLSLNSYFGEDVSNYYHENSTVENILNMGTKSSQIKNNDDFLQALKEFRSNL